LPLAHPLVPSATLFRSAAAGETFDQWPGGLVEDLADFGGTRREHRVQFAGIGADGLGGFVGALADMLAHRREGLRDGIGTGNELDRKSTRLNSSHVKIS